MQKKFEWKVETTEKMWRIIKKITGPGVIIIMLFACFITSIVSSCSTSECFDNQNSLPLAGFYSSGENPVAIALDYVSILGIGAPGDSILEDSVRNLSQVYLPFRIDQGSTSYEIRYHQESQNLFNLVDVITFNYDIIPFFVSAACGTVYNYKINSIETTHTFIDSVVCPGGVITNANSENLKIYFRTGVDE